MTDLSNQKPIESSLDEVAKGAADGMKTKILLELDSKYTYYKERRGSADYSSDGDRILYYQCQSVMDALHELKRRILELE